MKLTCEIVQDLLPLYEDDMCSKESKEAIEEHLRECEDCRNQLKMIRELSAQEIPVESSGEHRAVTKGFKKIRRRWMASLLVVILLIPTCIMGWSQYKGTGTHFTNLNDLYIANSFMKQLQNGNYEKAFEYIDTDSKKEEWLENEMFQENELTEFESDALAKFLEIAAEVEDAGGIQEYRYLGVQESPINDDPKYYSYEVNYSVMFGGKKYELTVNVTNDGIREFNCWDSFGDNSLTRLGMWSEYLWQDYEGCYYDTETGEYVYYDEVE